ncbi:PucR family transcriptional regulator ligand-binding domain-containing protein [Jiangella alba]|uniref:PucR family transcriptional regulator ligand-binding domain-containing protein n=1 Tax=Jiangella alba TaxID=561176 RepID=UPI0009F4FA56|nr:PucR family transcriptional regulator ligand-binding domain-containing protein [Jiangella alba]
MTLTLRRALESSSLKVGAPTVLAGGEHLDRPVRWVHVSEVLDLGGLLSGGELILTTGLPLRGDTATAVGYIEELAGAGAAGLVVELGPAFAAVPAAVVASAERAGLPLVCVSRQVRFVDITEQIHRAIVSAQLVQLEFAQEVHETFTRLSLEAPSTNQIIAAACDLCATSVVLEDLGRSVVTFRARGRKPAALLANWANRSRAAAVLDRTGRSGPEGWLTTPVGTAGRRWARLTLPHPDPADDERNAMVLERAAAALELARMAERDQLALELQAQGGFLAELAAERLTRADAAVRAQSSACRTRPHTWRPWPSPSAITSGNSSNGWRHAFARHASTL